MIAGNVLFKAVLGVASVGTVATVAYKSVTTEFYGSKNHVFLVVSASNYSSLQKKALNNNNNDKNYKCSFSNQEEDEDCKIYILQKSWDARSLIFKDVLQKPLKNTEELKDTNNDFLVKINEEKWNYHSKAGNLNFDLVSTSSNNEKFATLTQKLQIKNEVNEIKSDFLVAKLNLKDTTQNTEEIITETKCSIKETVYFPCQVLKSSEKMPDNLYTKLTASSSSQITKTTDLIKDDYYVLDFLGKKFSEAETIGKEIKVFLNKATTFHKFSFEQQLIGFLHSNKTQKTLFPVANEDDMYFVGKVKELTIPSETTLELYDATTNVKNFKCKSTASEEDESCILFPIITNTENQTLVLLNTVKTTNTKARLKSEITKDSYFKIKLSKKKLTKLNWTSASNPEITIDIKESSTDKKYATLTLLYKEENNKLLGKTQYVIGTADKKLDSKNEAGSFFCSLNNENPSTKQTCEIFKFTNEPSLQEEIKLKDLEATKVDKLEKITNNKLYIIDLKSLKYDLSTTKPSFISISDSASGTNIFELKNIDFFEGQLDNTDPQIKRGIFLQ